jgi:hypothetical protein
LQENPSAAAQFRQKPLLAKTQSPISFNALEILHRRLAIVEEARGYRGRALIGHINRAINLSLRPLPGAWLSPLDVLRLGTGDCKDYALAKYFTLRQVGIVPDRLRLVIVRNKRRGEDHMVVAADERRALADPRQSDDGACDRRSSVRGLSAALRTR